MTRKGLRINFFYRQQDCFSDIDSNKDDKMLIALAKDYKNSKNKISKQYFSISFDDLKKNITKNNHMYELVRTNQPRKLAFDIEFVDSVSRIHIEEFS